MNSLRQLSILFGLSLGVVLLMTMSAHATLEPEVVCPAGEGPGNCVAEPAENGTIKLTADPLVVPVDCETTLTALVTDSAGDPCSGITVTFTAAGGTFNPSNTATTASNGLASVNVKWASKGDKTIDASAASSNGGTFAKDPASDDKVTVVELDIDALKVSHNAANGELSDDDEENPGAFVPRNTDDDDYDSANTADSAQSGAIVGESDLLQIVIRTAPDGEYTLTIPTAVKVWKNSDRTDQVSGSTTLDATTEITLYVEGVAKGSGLIKLNWTSESEETKNDVDRIKVTVFEWTGPLNVPDYGIFQYIASGAVAGSHWTTPVGGTITEGQNTSDVLIHWGTGPTIGKAVYSVNDNYIWDLEVNIVEIKIASPDEGSAFVTKTPTDNGTFVDGNNVLSKTVSAADEQANECGLEWKAKITLNGPLGDRGVKQMRIGFAQNITVSSFRGNYDTENKTLVSSIEGNSYLDYEDNGTPPYFRNSGLSVFFDPSPQNKTKTIDDCDRPDSGPPLTFDKGATVDVGDDILDSMTLTWDFVLYVIARTSDTTNGANDIYTNRAKANWQFDGSGTVGQADPYAWTAGAAAGIDAPDSWSAVTDGSQPNPLGGTQFNTALRSDTWDEP